jgi:hypothetical protein
LLLQICLDEIILFMQDRKSWQGCGGFFKYSTK